MKQLHLPEIVPAVTEIWLIEFDFDSKQLIDDWSLLSVDEQTYSQCFRQHEDRVRSIVTCATLRRLLAKYLMLPPYKISIERDAFGKPRLPTHYGIEFNISHSGDFALIALSAKGEIGVDIEYCHRDVSNLCVHALSLEERTQGIWSKNNFIERWIIKESILKALGLGISEHLPAITVSLNTDGSYRVIHDRRD